MFHPRRQSYVLNVPHLCAGSDSLKHICPAFPFRRPFFETASGWDVTKSVKKPASRKLTEWIKLAAGKAFSPADKGLSSAQLLATFPQEHSKYPVYTETPKRGIYYTYEEFLANTPADTGFIERHWNTEGYEDLYILYPQGKRQKRE